MRSRGTWGIFPGRKGENAERPIMRGTSWSPRRYLIAISAKQETIRLSGPILSKDRCRARAGRSIDRISFREQRAKDEGRLTVDLDLDAH